MNVRKIHIVGIIILLTTCIISQPPPSGMWREYTSFSEPVAIDGGNGRIFCASRSGIFYYDTLDYTINKITKGRGLNDINITAIKYIPEKNYLFVGYESGNLDLVTSNDVINFPYIKRKRLTAEKRINAFYLYDSFIYIATGFGLVKFDIDRKEIIETYYLGKDDTYVQITDLTIFKDTIYVASNQRFIKAPLNDEINLQDEKNWTEIILPGMNDGIISNVESDDNNLVALFIDNKNVDDVVLKYSTTGWDSLERVDENVSRALYLVDENAYTIGWHTVKSVNIHSQKRAIQWLDATPVGLFYEKEFWYYFDQGLISYSSLNTDPKFILPDGPRSRITNKLHISNNRLYAVNGAITATYTQTYKPAFVYLYEKNNWTNLHNPNVQDYYTIVSDPSDTGRFFVGAWGHGLFEYKNNEVVNAYTYQNTEEHTLTSIIANAPYIRIGGMQFDKEGNLWMTNSQITNLNTISVLKRDGSWKAFNFGHVMKTETLTELFINDNSDIWVLLPRSEGIFVFNTGDDIDNEGDDFKKKFKVIADDENISTITCLAKDLNGNLWMGSASGPVVYYNTDYVTQEDGNVLYCNRILIPRNEGYGLADYLLQDQPVTSIAIDGGNRKWMGTVGSGVFLFSESGETEIEHFTVDNSPLPSNHIIDIEIHPVTGEVFIATYDGLVSFGGAASGGKESYSDVKVFPNPVRENYYGNITINGLVADSYIKITDMAGKLVYETISEGGTATWDGKNLFGERVSTGIYLVFGTIELGESTMVTKIAFIH